MRRREFFLGTESWAILLGGCLDTRRDDLTAEGTDDTASGDASTEGAGETRPTEIVDWESEKDGIDTETGPFDPPEITVDRERASVTVVGHAPAGNACGYLEVREPRYDPGRSTLEIEVEDGSEAPDCGDEFNSETYRVVVRFDRGIPGRIDATEPSATATNEPE